MSKHITPATFIELPSGSKVHPNRLIQRDGTLMWKHALLYNNELHVPKDSAVEAHIIKTAQRLEELNSWVSQSLEPWECFVPTAWYVPDLHFLNQGISLFFKHSIHSSDYLYTNLKSHIHNHERLELQNNQLYFQRC